jgi:hypothetical protein
MAVRCIPIVISTDGFISSFVIIRIPAVEEAEGFQAFGLVGSGETTTAIGRHRHPSVRFLLRLFTAEVAAVALLAAGRTASKIVQSSVGDYVIIRP